MFGGIWRRCCMLLVLLVTLVLFELPAIIGIFSTVADSGPAPNSEAVVNFDQACRVVHVAISPWKAHYDLEKDRALRVVKAVFNA